MSNKTHEIGGQGRIPARDIRFKIISPGGNSGSGIVIVPSDEPTVVPPVEHVELLNAVRRIAPEGEALSRFVRWRKQDLLHGKLNEVLEMIRLQDPEQTDNKDFDETIQRANANQIDTLVTLLRNSTALNQRASIADMLISLDEEAFILRYLIPVLEQKSGFMEVDRVFCCSLLNALSDEDLEAMFSKIDFNSVTNFDNIGESLSSLDDPYRVVSALLNIAPYLDYFESHGDETYQRTKQIQLVALRIIEKSKPPTLSPGSLKGRQDPLETLYSSSVDPEILFGAGNHLITQRGKQAAPIICKMIWDESRPDDYMHTLKRFYAIGQYAGLLEEEATDELKKFILENGNVELVQIASFHLANTCDQEGKSNLVGAVYGQVSQGKPSIPLAFLSSLAKEHDLFVSLLQLVFALPFSCEHDLVEAYELASDIKLCKIVKDGGKFSLVTIDPNPDLVADLLNDIGLVQLSKWCSLAANRHSIEVRINERLVNVLRSNIKTLFQHALRKSPDKMNAFILGGIALQDNPEVRRFLLEMGDITSSERPLNDSLLKAIEGPDLQGDLQEILP